MLLVSQCCRAYMQGKLLEAVIPCKSTLDQNHTVCYKMLQKGACIADVTRKHCSWLLRLSLSWCTTDMYSTASGVLSSVSSVTTGTRCLPTINCISFYKYSMLKFWNNTSEQHRTLVEVLANAARIVVIQTTFVTSEHYVLATKINVPTLTNTSTRYKNMIPHNNLPFMKYQ